MLEDYLNLKKDQDLFPSMALKGTRFYDLMPENEEVQVVNFEHVENAIKKYMDKEISFETFSEWIDSLIALDLFRFDDRDNETLDRVAGLAYSIDDLKDDVDEIDFSTLEETLKRYKK